MTVSFVRASQTYNVEQKRSKKGCIGKRVASYDNTFFTDLDVATPFPVAEILICQFIEDILLDNCLTEIPDGDGAGWQYCNLQIVEDEITGKLSFSVRLAVQTKVSVYAAEYHVYSRAGGYDEPLYAPLDVLNLDHKNGDMLVAVPVEVKLDEQE